MTLFVTPEWHLRNERSAFNDGMATTRKTIVLNPLQTAPYMLQSQAGLFLQAWGAMAAVAPEHLLGPNSAPILDAEYKGFRGHSWSDLTSTSPMIAGFITLLFRMYGTFSVAFALMAITVAVTAFRMGDGWAWWALLVGNTLAFVAAMTYDRTVGAIGPFELTENLGLGVVYLALAVAVPRKTRVSPHNLEPGK